MVSKSLLIDLTTGRNEVKSKERGEIHVPGSPNVTAAAIFCAASAGSSLAALWTSCPPWL